jgi:hypothetical protein
MNWQAINNSATLPQNQAFIGAFEWRKTINSSSNSARPLAAQGSDHFWEVK